MAQDVESVDKGSAAVAGRLCNFATGRNDLLLSHRSFIDTQVIPVLKKHLNPWVDLFGYASRLGNADANKHLSDKRCEAVVQYIRSSVPNVSFPQKFGFGEAKSTGSEKDNDGYWRAVELFVYATKPPNKPKPPVTVDDWFVTEFSGRSESVVLGLGYSAMTGKITFTRADGIKYRGDIGMFGFSTGLGLNIGSVPGLGNLLQRFPVLQQFLREGPALSNALLKWAIQPGVLQWIIGKTPGGMRLFTALSQVILGGAVAPESMPSRAIGMVFPFKPPLSTTSFYGSCMCYAATATAAIANGGTYILFFGYRGDMFSTSFSMDNFSGCAIISAVGAQVQVPGLSAAGTLFVGEIT